MEEALFRTMLFDSYGELLTEKQREYFDLHYNEDLSLAEIAQSEGCLLYTSDAERGRFPAERVGHHPPRRGDDAPV